MENQSVAPQIQASPLETPPAIPKEKSNKWLIITLALLFLIASGVAGYFAYQNIQLKNNLVPNVEPSTTPTSGVNLPEATPTPLPEVTKQPEIPSPIPTLDATTNWQPYTNEEYKLSFKYPNDYYLSDKSLKILPEDTNSFLGIIVIKEKNKEVGQPPTLGLSIVQTEKSSKEFLDYNHQRELTSWEGFEEERGFVVDKPYIISEENVQNNQLTALKVERQRMPTAPHSKETWYMIKKDNLLFILSVNYGTYNPDTDEDGTDEKNALDLIFSTFKSLQ